MFLRLHTHWSMNSAERWSGHANDAIYGCVELLSTNTRRNNAIERDASECFSDWTGQSLSDSNASGDRKCDADSASFPAANEESLEFAQPSVQ